MGSTRNTAWYPYSPFDVFIYTVKGDYQCTKGKPYFPELWTFSLLKNFVAALTAIKLITECAFTCFDQFLCMAFAQLTYRESLRGIECCFRAIRTKLYHM